MGRLFNACVVAYCALLLASTLKRRSYNASFNQEVDRTGQLPEETPDVIHSGLARLSQGNTYFRMEGNRKSAAPLVVLIHGFVGCHKDFDPLVEELKKAGRRVLRIDNYGRGWSSHTRVHVRDSPEMFAGQIAEILHFLNESEAVDLVGYSMGGGIVAYYAGVYGSAKVASLSLLAPAGLSNAMKSPALRYVSDALYLVSLQPFADAGLLWLGGKLVEKLLSRETMGFEEVGEKELEYLKFSEERIDNEILLPHAIVKSITEYPWTDLNFAFEAVASHKIPTIAIWSKADKQVSFACSAELDTIYEERGAKLQTYIFEDQGHKFPLTKSTVVANELVSFWSKRM